MATTYTPNLPQSGQKISATQSPINNNFLAIDSAVNGFVVDHVSMTNTSDGGKHKQVTFNDNNTAGAQTGNKSVVYTQAGTADTSPQLFWRNADLPFHISPIRAWGVVDSNGGISSSQSYNVVSATRVSTGGYEVVLTTGATGSANYAVVATSQLSGSLQTNLNYTISSATLFVVYIAKTDNSSQGLNATFSFMVLQL